MSTDDRIRRAGELYERAVFHGEEAGLAVADRELDSIDADLALARGRIVHARYLSSENVDPQELALFERAAQLYEALGDARGEGEALLWIGIYHQVVCRDDASAVPLLGRAHDLSAAADDKLTLSYALRHLGIAEHRAGRLENARQHLQRSTRLREELQFLPGVAANLVGLAYIAAAQGRTDEAIAIAEEADRIAVACHAHAVVRQAKEVRAAISS